MARTWRKGPSMGLAVWPFVALVALILSMAAFIDPTPNREGAMPEPRTPTAHSDEQVEAAARMTERMRAGAGLDPGGRLADGEPGDALHPQAPAFIEKLERYQQDVDRMLGRGAP